MASSHYSLATQNVMNSVGINYVPKVINPPNVPQVRPIETFWAHLKRRVYENGWTTDNTKDLTKRIRKLIKSSDENVAQNLMACLKTKVRKAADRGPLSVITNRVNNP